MLGDLPEMSFSYENIVVLSNCIVSDESPVPLDF